MNIPRIVAYSPFLEAIGNFFLKMCISVSLGSILTIDYGVLSIILFFSFDMSIFFFWALLGLECGTLPKSYPTPYHSS